MTKEEDPLRELGRFLAEEVGAVAPAPISRKRPGAAAENHFELGVAFAQMGLVDEALVELEHAATEPRLRVPSAALLGAMHLDRGEPERAIGWYRCGLATRGLPRHTRLGLLYDLGRAHLAAGDRRRARRAFTLAAEIDPGFEGVVPREGAPHTTK